MAHAESAESLDFLLGQCCKLHRGRMFTLFEELGLYHGQPPMLFVLWEQDGQTHTELAGRLHIQASTVTKMVQRMEKAGFIERRDDPDDQRVSRVYLTDAGYAIREDVNRIWRQLEDETFDGFTPEEQVLLRRFFLQMRENLLRAGGSLEW